MRSKAYTVRERTLSSRGADFSAQKFKTRKKERVAGAGYPNPSTVDRDFDLNIPSNPRNPKLRDDVAIPVPIKLRSSDAEGGVKRRKGERYRESTTGE